jgi:hypothetical protein
VGNCTRKNASDTLYVAFIRMHRLDIAIGFKKLTMEQLLCH